MVTGGIAIFISLLNSPALWLMLILRSFYWIERCGNHWCRFYKTHFGAKQMIILETEEPKQFHPHKTKQQWIGNERIGNQVYEWDDINIDIFSGDTIIDLGNTLLPKKKIS